MVFLKFTGGLIGTKISIYALLKNNKIDPQGVIGHEGLLHGVSQVAVRLGVTCLEGSKDNHMNYFYFYKKWIRS